MAKATIPSKRKALFLDRDGIINEDNGYPYKPEQIRFMGGIFQLCKIALDKGYILIVVTNQGGIAMGYYNENDVISLHKWMGDRFKEQGIEISAFYYCPYRKDGIIPEYAKESTFRKPKPGMLLQAAKEFSIDIENSIIIGDKPSDRIELEGLRSIIVKSKYCVSDYDAENLEEVIKLI